MEETEALAILELARNASRALRTQDAPATMARLEQQLAALEMAFDWFLDRDRSDEVTELATSLAGFWTASGRLDTGSEWLARSLSSGPSELVRPAALFESGLLAFWQGDDDSARRLHQESLDTARRIGDRTGTALALSGLARVALRDGTEEARRLGLEALEAVKGTGDSIGTSNALHVLGVAAQMAGDLEEARGYMSKRLKLARELGELSSVASEAGNLSVVERQLGNLDRARELADESLRISVTRRDEWIVPYNLNGLAAIALENEDLDRAATLLGAAEAIMERQGASWPPDERPHFEATRDGLVESMQDEAFASNWAAGGRMTPDEAVNYALG